MRQVSPFDPAGLRERLAQIEKIISDADFWNDPEAAQKIMKEKKSIDDSLAELDGLTGDMEELQLLCEMAEEENDEELASEAATAAASLKAGLEQLKIKTLLGDKYDRNNAIIQVHAGSGGTDAQDWAELLLRMYTRWCEKKKYKARMLDLQDDPEADRRVLSADDSAYNRPDSCPGWFLSAHLAVFRRFHRLPVTG